MDDVCSFDEKKGLLTVTGELTIYQVARIYDALCYAAASQVLSDIDLTGVTEMDGAGLQWLIQAERLANTQQHPTLKLQKNTLITTLQQLTATTIAVDTGIATPEALL